MNQPSGMCRVVPDRLSAGDEVRVVAPSTSLLFLSNEVRKIADERFADLGLTLSFGEHVAECDDFGAARDSASNDLDR